MRVFTKKRQSVQRHLGGSVEELLVASCQKSDECRNFDLLA